MDGAILLDPSLDFDCLPHVMLFAKYDAYGLVMLSNRLMNSYLRKGSNTLRSMIPVAHGQRSFFTWPNATSLAPYYSIFLCDSCFFRILT